MLDPTAEKIGLIAGWGRYPLVLAAALKQQQRQVYCIGITGHADPQLAEICDDFTFKGVAKLGGCIRYFQRNNVHLATMAGKIHKTLMFQRYSWLRHLPDWRCVQTFYPHFVTLSKDRADDTLLTAVIDAYASDGITLAPATDFAPELLVKPGKLTSRRLSRSQEKDIEFGWRLAKEMGRLDIGQTVAVKGQAVLAIEAVEGTDACIRRAGELCPKGDFTVVKVAKPEQDMRFDVPTIGLGTLDSLLAAGATVLAVEAGRTIIIDEQAMIQAADRHGIAIVACEEPFALPAARDDGQEAA
ncbi:LpxI family protein [Lignipirellula cremea]|uniref:UDP-2,3-diacylglucosamine pyrophosphatase LpxI n=1 Tax=Lignipirellula cremea TaxID=2528010 RepID=A0A518DPM5_9BACT|nr:UDP-2,3-diacylglucosamine diphosphatase LpxI [Lignipirellula cremea]QDU93791.1 hypothetical protein Pla8534_15740 [Lignipirellula cremea]